MIFAGYALGRAFGWNQMDSVFLGAIFPYRPRRSSSALGLGKTRDVSPISFQHPHRRDILAIV
jgi:hypothetical protein